MGKRLSRPESVATLRGLTFWYPGAPSARPALADLSLTVQSGTLVLLCGPSGGGKSTFLRLWLGLVPQLSGGELAGEIEVLGRDPTTTPPHEMAAAGCGLLFQNPGENFVGQRVEEEVAFGPENLALPADEIETRVAASLAAVGLAGFEVRKTRELSVGQQQRVALAAALALEPRVLLLDEPTAHLDEETARGVLALIERIHRERGATVILSEHRLGLAAPLADRALVLADGRLVGDGPPRELFADPSLPELGVPVPRASQAAVRLGLQDPLPLTPAELAPRLARPHAMPAPEGEGTILPLPLGAAGERSEPGEDSPPGLSFDHVSFTYPGQPSPTLADVTFALQAGEIVGLMGPSGAGKSTLARLALGLLTPTQGEVRLAGLSTQRTPFRRLADLGGLVLQDPLQQLLAARVDDELRLGLRELLPDERRQRVDDLLAAFGLEEVRARHPLALSEGQRRRVAMAAVLARRPRILVLDEPTLGQDECQGFALAALLARLAAEGTAVLAISHNPELVNDACDRVMLLSGGRLLADLPMHLAGDAPERLAEAGLPLADVPATVRELARLGSGLRARRVEDLVAQLT